MKANFYYWTLRTTQMLSDVTEERAETMRQHALSVCETHFKDWKTVVRASLDMVGRYVMEEVEHDKYERGSLS